MGSISIPTMVAIGASVAATGAAAYESHLQGVATANEAKAKARQESISAAQQQIDMRQKMLRALASQNAGTLGGIGTGLGTSFGANAMRQINEAQNDIMVSRSDSSAKLSLLDMQGENALQAGNAQAIGDVLQGTAKFFGR
jgi:uncharacterized BrkB/YihY/UPF0761 family membrane protein